MTCVTAKPLGHVVEVDDELFQCQIIIPFTLSTFSRVHIVAELEGGQTGSTAGVDRAFTPHQVELNDLFLVANDTTAFFLFSVTALLDHLVHLEAMLVAKVLELVLVPNRSQ